MCRDVLSHGFPQQWVSESYFCAIFKRPPRNCGNCPLTPPRRGEPGRIWVDAQALWTPLVVVSIPKGSSHPRPVRSRWLRESVLQLNFSHPGPWEEPSRLSDALEGQACQKHIVTAELWHIPFLSLSSCACPAGHSAPRTWLCPARPATAC